MLASALLGMAGAGVVEVMRIIAALRLQKGPSGLELLASLFSVLLGLGVLLFETTGDSRLEIAVLGAAFPQIFSGMVAAAKVPDPDLGRGEASDRRLVDYISWSL